MGLFSRENFGGKEAAIPAQGGEAMHGMEEYSNPDPATIEAKIISLRASNPNGENISALETLFFNMTGRQPGQETVN